MRLRSFDTAIGFDNCDNEKRFMDIDATTGLVSNFHKLDSFRKKSEAIDWTATQLNQSL